MGFPLPTSQLITRVSFRLRWSPEKMSTGFTALKTDPDTQSKRYIASSDSCISVLVTSNIKHCLSGFPIHSLDLPRVPASRSLLGIGGSVSLALIHVADWSKSDYCPLSEAFDSYPCTARFLPGASPGPPLSP